MDDGTNISASLILIIVQNDEQMFSLYRTMMSYDKASSIIVPSYEQNKIISFIYLLQNGHKREEFIKWRSIFLPEGSL